MFVITYPFIGYCLHQLNKNQTEKYSTLPWHFMDDRGDPSGK